MSIIKSSYDVPIILLGDYNSRTSIATDFEDTFEHERSILAENPHKQGILKDLMQRRKKNKEKFFL